MTQLFLTKGSHPRGRGFWKFNTSLLKDLDYVNTIKSEIKETIEQNQNLNPLILWDFLKCHIRGETIAYSSFQSRKRKDRVKELTAQIETLEKELARSDTENVKQLLEKNRKELETIIEYKTAGVMQSSKARWIEHGEKNAKYFFNLERRNYNKKVITKLKRNDGTELNSQRDILKEEESFYTEIFILRTFQNHLKRRIRRSKFVFLLSIYR